jgi:flavin reductase (DIM6/NTAB) family NADH-FMN oxidoreductase RutF
MIGADDFRRVLGNFPTGVTIVTTADPQARPAGLTVSAFSSVSLDPPLILVCVDHKSESFPALVEAGRFAVNILSTEQETLSRRFASKRGDKFDEVAFRVGHLGVPLLEGALVHVECVTVRTYDGGDHTIFLGQVEHASIGKGDPLLYCRGRYDRLSSAV